MRKRLLDVLENILQWLATKKKLCLLLSLISFVLAVSIYINIVCGLILMLINAHSPPPILVTFGKLILEIFFLMLCQIFLILWKGNNGWDKRGNRAPDPPPDPKLTKDLVEEIIKSTQEKLRNKQVKKEPALV